MSTFILDEIEYPENELTTNGRQVLGDLKFIEARIVELKGTTALLNKAKNSYIEHLRVEIVQKRSGIELDSLFSDN